MKTGRTSAILAAVLLASCQSPGEGVAAKETASTAVHAVSGLPLIPLRIETGAGVRDFTVELASEPAQQARGLMFRTELDQGEGMLFVFDDDPPTVRSFWMKNTVIPLDMIFIGPDRAIESIVADTTPYSLDPVPSQGPAIAVLELAGGESRRLGLSPGDKVEWGQSR